jgi:protein-disulfide isomerase
MPLSGAKPCRYTFAQMASRAEQKAAARAAREAKHREIVASKQRRQRLTVLAGIVAVAIAAVVVAIVVSSGGGGPPNTKAATKVPASSQKTVATYVNSDLAGIPQSNNTLGNPNAPVTVTEYGDLVCPVCADFAVTSEPELIASEVKTGKVKLVYKAFDTASSYANQSEFATSQAAALSAGLQGKEWNFILTVYYEQPTTIDGKAAEDLPYVNTTYLQSRAQQISGLNLIKWQAGLVNPTLLNQVSADLNSGKALGVGNVGTPSIIITGPRGQQYYDQNGSESAVPTLQQLQQLIAQVS